MRITLQLLIRVLSNLGFLERPPQVEKEQARNNGNATREETQSFGALERNYCPYWLWSTSNHARRDREEMPQLLPASAVTGISRKYPDNLEDDISSRNIFSTLSLQFPQFKFWQCFTSGGQQTVGTVFEIQDTSFDNQDFLRQLFRLGTYCTYST